MTGEEFFDSATVWDATSADFAYNFLLRYWPILFAVMGVGLGVFVYQHFARVPRSIDGSPEFFADRVSDKVSSWFGNEQEDPYTTEASWYTTSTGD
jgi:hypothetical protein